MSYTKKGIIDSIMGLATKFSLTDDESIDPDWLSAQIDLVRAELIVKQYNVTGIVDMAWLTNLGLLNCYKTQPSDDNSITCSCSVAKTTIPQVISLQSRDFNNDLGLFQVTSSCLTKTITPYPMARWGRIPSENTNSLFTYYSRVNTDLYISDPNIQKIKVVAILLTPEDGKYVNSAPIASGSLVNGTSYKVLYGSIVYISVVYNTGATFAAGATATFTGNGKVYLNTQSSAYTDVLPYPASGEMIRQIELEILTKEFKIEEQALVDVRNDSVDDAVKAVKS